MKKDQEKIVRGGCGHSDCEVETCGIVLIYLLLAGVAVLFFALWSQI